MKHLIKKKLWGYIGRFSLIHVIVYAVTAFLFLKFQKLLPATNQTALEFYEPYQLLGIKEMLMQIIRGGVLALILYPAYKTIVNSKHGVVILFGFLWGISLLCSVEPRPGSIEGLIYTKTTLIEHFAVLTAGALQTLVFSWLFLRWERASTVILEKNIKLTAKGLAGYLGRFTLLHILTYIAVGMIFYQLQDYEQALATKEAFKLFRSLEQPSVVGGMFLGQIVRGGILALLFYPLYDTFFNNQHGWRTLFIILWGLTYLGTGNIIPDLIQGVIIKGEFLAFGVGISEITTQMLLFSILLFVWETTIDSKV